MDIKQYAGLWYDIAHSPNFYQNFCDYSTSQYTVLSDTQISILATCYSHVRVLSTANGSAQILNPADPTKLFIDLGYLLKGAYEVIMIDPNPNALWVVLSSADKSSLFILARQEPMKTELQQEILHSLNDMHIDTTQLIYDKYQSSPRVRLSH